MALNYFEKLAIENWPGGKGKVGLEMWAKIEGAGTEPGSREELETKMTPLSDLKTLLLGEKDLEVNDTRRPAMKLILENPEGTKKLNAFLAKPENDAVKKFMADKFENGKDTAELTRIAQEAMKDPVNIIGLMTAKDATPVVPAPVPLPEVAKPNPQQVAESATDRAAIRAVLAGLTDTKDAADMANLKNVKFRNAAGEYVNGAPDAESLKHVEITINGQKRYFTQVGVKAATADDQLRAAAWAETQTDGKTKLTFVYPGYNTNGDEKAMQEVGKANFNPQMNGVPKFVDSILAQYDIKNIAAINIAGASIGSSNAQVSHLYLDVKKIPTEITFLQEPSGASLANTKLREALQDKNSPIYKAIVEANNTTPEAVLAQLDAEKTISQRSFIIDEHGNAVLSHASGLQPGAGDITNANTALNGRVGEIDPNNQMVGEKEYLNITGRPNLSTSALGKIDPLHAAVNIASALIDKAEVKTAAEVEPKIIKNPITTPAADVAASNDNAQTPAAPKKSGLKELAEKDPEFDKLMKSVMAKSMTAMKDQKPDPALEEKNKKIMGDLFTDLDQHPEKLAPLADRIQTDARFRKLVQDTLDKQTTGDKPFDAEKTVGQFKQLMALAAEPDAPGKPNTLTKSIELSTKLDKFKAAHPDLVKFIPDEPIDLDKLTPQFVDAKTAQLTAIDNLFNHHPEVNKWVADHIAAGDANDPQAKDLIGQILQKPELIAKFDTALNNPLVSKALLGGDFNLANLPNLLGGSNELVEVIDDEDVTKLIKGSKLAVDNPLIASVLNTTFMHRMAANARKALHEPETEQDKKLENPLLEIWHDFEKGDFMGALLTLCALFMSNEGGLGAMTSLAQSLAPQQVQSQTQTPQQQAAGAAPGK